jgi:hypothetical protein
VAESPETEPPAEADEDFFADWNLVFAEEPSPDPRNSVTEAVPRAEGPADTEVIPVAPELESAERPPRPSRHPPPRGFPWGASVALVGGMAVVVSAILPWTGGGALPRDIAARSLIQAGGEGGLNLGVVLLVAGTIGSLVALLTMLVPWVGFLRRLVGILTLAMPVLFVLRAMEPGAGVGGLVGALDVGVYVAGAGALVQVIAGKWRT